MYNLNQRTF